MVVSLATLFFASIIILSVGLAVGHIIGYKSALGYVTRII